MPYIKQEDRPHFERAIEEAVTALTKNGKALLPGELNYLVSSIIWKVFNKSPSYTVANNMIGALNCVVLEFYRQKVAPYEDEKIRENGDI